MVSVTYWNIFQQAMTTHLQ